MLITFTPNPSRLTKATPCPLHTWKLKIVACKFN